MFRHSVHFDVHGSVHHSTIHEEKSNNATMYQNIIIPYLYEAQHFLGDTTHHQEPKTALTASGFSYIEGCWTCGWWMLSGTV